MKLLADFFGYLGQIGGGLMSILSVVAMIFGFCFLVWVGIKHYKSGGKFTYNSHDLYEPPKQPECSATRVNYNTPSHHRDYGGCYGINPATGLPLSSPGQDIGGNPLGPSHRSY